jgi:hypothetical protein
MTLWEIGVFVEWGLHIGNFFERRGADTKQRTRSLFPSGNDIVLHLDEGIIGSKLRDVRTLNHRAAGIFRPPRERGGGSSFTIAEGRLQSKKQLLNVIGNPTDSFLTGTMMFGPIRLLPTFATRPGEHPWNY